jgi:hypothetical protein
MKEHQKRINERESGEWRERERGERRGESGERDFYQNWIRSSNVTWTKDPPLSCTVVIIRKR